MNDWDLKWSLIMCYNFEVWIYIGLKWNLSYLGGFYCLIWYVLLLLNLKGFVLMKRFWE